MAYKMGVFFAGAGGDAQGSASVPGVNVVFAANHWARAIETHALNFPDTEHYCGDIKDVDLRRLPEWDLFWASPECTFWSQGRGERREFDKQPDLFGETLPDEAAERSRALMWDVPRYLEAMKVRGRPVLAGVVENVVEAREGAQWAMWVASIRNLGYRTRVIALNSMHARPSKVPYAPQSRDRLYVAYWLETIPDPDWDKWLRPHAWCPSCEQPVSAIQTFKKPGRDMGRYRQQYVYRCPKVSCRGQAVEPAVLPAAVAIDWDHLGQRIGDRARPLAPKTIARIEAGLKRYAIPIYMQTGGSERSPGTRAHPVSEPMTTQTAQPTKALASLPLMVPAGGTWREDATPVTDPMRARTTRENDGLAVAPFVTIHRGGPDEVRTRGIEHELPTQTASGNALGIAVPPFVTELRNNSTTRPVSDPLSTVTTMGAHHGLAVTPFITMLRGSGNQATPVSEPLATLMTGNNHYLTTPAMVMRNNTVRGDAGQMCTPVSEPVRTLTTHGHQSLIDWRHLLVPYYGTGVARPVIEPAATIPATDRFALASPAVDVEDVLFRMLEPGEISAAMAFTPNYVLLGSKRERVRMLGNAVTPPVAEVIVSALVEAISGQSFEVAA